MVMKKRYVNALLLGMSLCVAAPGTAVSASEIPAQESAVEDTSDAELEAIMREAEAAAAGADGTEESGSDGSATEETKYAAKLTEVVETLEQKVSAGGSAMSKEDVSILKSFFESISPEDNFATVSDFLSFVLSSYSDQGIDGDDSHVTQEQAGCLARDITITDVIDTEGVKLQKNSIVLIDEDGNKIEPESVEVNGNTFTVNTGRNLINNKSGYTTVDMSKADDEKGDSGYFQNGEYNPLGIDKESKLTLEYAVEITDEDLAGQSIHNTVTANSKENIPVEDEHEVLVYGPALDIVKESDKVEYQVGEKAQYKLTIRELRDNITAKQVVVTDTFEKEGMKISKINVRLNGEKLDGAEIEQTADNAFVINTGADLTIEDKLEVFYTVVFTDPSLHDQDIVNVATAKGENTEEERQDNCVHIVDETPGLQIKKSSDKTSYKVGETGHYTVVVSNTEKGTTARNVIIKDALQVEGAKIVDGSIKIYNDAGKLMDDAEIEHSDTDYAIATGHDLEYKEQFTVNYDVLFEAETLAGKDILNVARATCDNLRVETKTPSPIKLANGLEVYKSADPATGSVVKKSIKADVTKADNGFVVNTNTDLAYGSTLKITYQAVVSDSSLAGKMVGNTAIASADNADDVAANAGVSIAENPSPSETPAPSTTPAPGADSSDNTTNTVGPKTGLVNHAGMYAGIGLGIVAVAAIAVFVMRRKKK